MSHPAGLAVIRRMKANTLMTMLAQNVETPKDEAKTGTTGTTIPNPKATQNATKVTVGTSLGKSPNCVRMTVRGLNREEVRVAIRQSFHVQPIRQTHIKLLPFRR
jgi:hypothetical protein